MVSAHRGEGPKLSRSRTAVCLALALGFVYVTADILLHGPLRQLDHSIYGELLLVDDRNLRWWTSFVIAEAGNEFILLPVLGIVTLAASWRTWSIRPMVISFVVCSTLGLLVPGIKIITGRTKPLAHGHDSVFAGGTTFPSGHTANAIILVGLSLEFLVIAWPVLQRWLTVPVRRALVWVAAFLAGAGTLGLSYHWFTDVLGGWLIGALMLVLLLGLDVLGPLHAKVAERQGPPAEVPPGGAEPTAPRDDPAGPRQPAAQGRSTRSDG